MAAKRIVLFIGMANANAAASAFNSIASRMGLPWASLVRDAPGPEISSTNRVVSLDRSAHEPLIRSQFPAQADAVEYWTAAAIPDQVNQFVARLLGGGQAPPVPPPAAPPRPKPIHTVKVGRETAGRRGKGVTVVSELPLGEAALKELATTLKQKCGTGGTVKDGRIEIQGDHRDRLVTELEKLGYRVKRAGG